MARVTLAYRYGEHAPDDTVDLDDAEAARLIRDGLARRADDEHPGAEHPDDQED